MSGALSMKKKRLSEALFIVKISLKVFRVFRMTVKKKVTTTTKMTEAIASVFRLLATAPMGIPLGQKIFVQGISKPGG